VFIDGKQNTTEERFVTGASFTYAPDVSSYRSTFPIELFLEMLAKT
jgi:hypothetical protein